MGFCLFQSGRQRFSPIIAGGLLRPEDLATPAVIL